MRVKLALCSQNRPGPIWHGVVELPRGDDTACFRIERADAELGGGDETGWYRVFKLEIPLDTLVSAMVEGAWDSDVPDGVDPSDAHDILTSYAKSILSDLGYNVGYVGYN